MIIGNGMMAKAFSHYEKNDAIVVYAKGVSNSQEKNILNFKRESSILASALQAHKDKIFIYFSTCSIYDSDEANSPYVLHKQKMENMVQDNNKNYYILRLPQVVGETSSPTLINFLSNKIINNESFDIWKKSYRNIIDADDVFRITDYLISNNILMNSVINIASSKSYNIVDLVHKIETLLDTKGTYKIIDKGSSYLIDISIVEKYFGHLSIVFDDTYINNLLEKYIGCKKRNAGRKNL